MCVSKHHRIFLEIFYSIDHRKFEFFKVMRLKLKGKEDGEIMLISLKNRVIDS
jgi:hypothetical protein